MLTLELHNAAETFANYENGDFYINKDLTKEKENPVELHWVMTKEIIYEGYSAEFSVYKSEEAGVACIDITLWKEQTLLLERYYCISLHSADDGFSLFTLANQDHHIVKRYDSDLVVHTNDTVERNLKHSAILDEIMEMQTEIYRL